MTTAVRPLLRAIDTARFLAWKARNDFAVPDEPHLDPQTRLLLQSEMEKASSYLEFGSGGSTVLAASTVQGPVRSVESDRKFLDAVEAKIAKAGLRKPTTIYADIGLTGPWGYPVQPWYSGRWRRYVDLVWTDMPEAPDLILIDGRFRAACALASMLHLARRGKKATIILDDYVGRASYQVVERFATKPRMAGRSLTFQSGEVDEARI